MNKYRANRTNYVVSYAAIIILGVAAALMLRALPDNGNGQNGTTILAALLVILFSIYLFLVWARMVILRSGDFGFPGWAGFLLAFFFTPAAVVFAFIPGTAGKNRYGPQPAADISLRSIFLR